MLKTLFARRMPLGLLLMLLLSTQIVATDLYLPALPQIASYFNRPAGQAQWTLTLFILSFGVAQLGAGSLVDHYGRRKVLLWGLGLYVLASTGGALAMQLPWLMLCRALQGAATSVCVISARAIVRDNYSGAAGLGIMARNMTGMGVVGVLSPLLGGLVAQHLGWHVTLVLMAVFGLLVWLSVYLWFADSYVRPDHIGDVMFFRFFTHPQFIFSSLIAGISFYARFFNRNGDVSSFVIALERSAFLAICGVLVVIGWYIRVCFMAIPCAFGVGDDVAAVRVYAGTWFSSTLWSGWCRVTVS
jgi:DHA1 family bicyclomycin/chloramphenicol resistance-like MFS transporter